MLLQSVIVLLWKMLGNGQSERFRAEDGVIALGAV